MKTRIPPRPILLGFLLAVLSMGSIGFSQQGGPGKQQRQEEREDYFSKWLNEDAVYLISDQERAVFEKLSTDQEKEQFIEQFWHRRDPDLRTSANEFKEEHYRRIAYANEWYRSGLPGWRTDRGRIYIVHGPPAEVEKHPTGGSYQRPASEGGGITKTVAFETWRYRFIEGIGPDVVLEFIDPSGSGEYRLSLDPAEKDVFLYSLSGPTLAEEEGLARREDRPTFSPGNYDSYPLAQRTMRENPFIKYENYARVMAPTPIRYDDLKQLVSINIRYNDLPFEVRPDYFLLTEDRVLVPINLSIQNKHLTFVSENGVPTARVAVYGIVTSIRNRIVTEFDHDLEISFRPDQLQEGLLGLSQYQKILALESNLRYKIDLVVKDLASKNTGVLSQSVLPPRQAPGKLGLSSVLLSTSIQRMEKIPDDEMFVIGDLKIRPSLDLKFRKGSPLGVYLHAYNVGLDQSTLAPALTVRYRLFLGEDQILEDVDENGESTQYASQQRVVLVKELPIRFLMPQRYRLWIEVEDRISGSSASTQLHFELTAPPQSETADSAGFEPRSGSR